MILKANNTCFVSRNINIYYIIIKTKPLNIATSFVVSTNICQMKYTSFPTTQIEINLITTKYVISY